MKKNQLVILILLGILMLGFIITIIIIGFNKKSKYNNTPKITKEVDNTTTSKNDDISSEEDNTSEDNTQTIITDDNTKETIEKTFTIDGNIYYNYNILTDDQQKLGYEMNDYIEAYVKGLNKEIKSITINNINENDDVEVKVIYTNKTKDILMITYNTHNKEFSRVVSKETYDNIMSGEYDITTQ